MPKNIIGKRFPVALAESAGFYFTLFKSITLGIVLSITVFHT